MTINIHKFVWFSPKYKTFINNITKYIIPIGGHFVPWKADKGPEISFVTLFNYMSFITLFPNLFNACTLLKKKNFSAYI